MLSDLAIVAELVGTCMQLKASCSRIWLQIHYHDLFVPRAVDSLCPPVVTPLLVFFMNMLQVLQWPSTARVHLQYCISMNLTGQSAVSYLFSHGGEDRLTGLVDLVPIILWSYLNNYSRQQSKNAATYGPLPNSKRIPIDVPANYVFSFPWYQALSVFA